VPLDPQLFPGSRVGVRLVDPISGAVLAESSCFEVPCP